MKSFRLFMSLTMIVLVCLVATGCKKACDDLEDLCASCSGDDRSSCEEAHDICDIAKGKAGNDCCEIAVDAWDDICS